jgi:hypothetical protein
MWIFHGYVQFAESFLRGIIIRKNETNGLKHTLHHETVNTSCIKTTGIEKSDPFLTGSRQTSQACSLPVMFRT